jgi:hypothetical protein
VKNESVVLVVYGVGADAKSALPALSQLQQDQAPIVRLAATEAINKINR